MVRTGQKNGWYRPEGERWLDQDQGININRCKKIGFESRIRFHPSFALRASLSEPKTYSNHISPSGRDYRNQRPF